MRILAIDPGERHLGAAVCDPGGVVARPLASFAHTSREQDAARIAALAASQQAELILIGLALDARDEHGPQARRAERLARAVRALTALPVELHDESFSSAIAAQHMLTAGRKRRQRREQIHAVAAAAILQSYLDARPHA